MEGDRGEDGGLGRRVVALDVRGRVGFGVAQPGGLGERLRVVRAGRAHLRQDVVGGAVDDAHHALDLIAGHRPTQGSDDGDRAGDGRLEVQVGVRRVRGLGQLVGVLGEQRLVRGHHGLAVAQRLEQEGTWEVDAAHELDDDVDVLARDERRRVRGEQIWVQPAVFGQVADGDAAQGQGCPDAGSQRLGVLGHVADDLGSDGAHPEHRHSHGSHTRRGYVAHCPTSRLVRSSRVSRRSISRARPSRTATTAGRPIRL